MMGAAALVKNPNKYHCAQTLWEIVNMHIDLLKSKVLPSGPLVLYCTHSCIKLMSVDELMAYLVMGRRQK